MRLLLTQSYYGVRLAPSGFRYSVILFGAILIKNMKDIQRAGDLKMATIRFDKVTKKYGDTVALNAFSHSFLENSVNVIIGKSGSGKSTLLQLLMGIQRPTSGTIFAFDQAIKYDDLIQHRRKFGYAVQGAGLFPHLRILENIMLPARMCEWPEAKMCNRARELLALVELPREYERRYPHELSGGEQQRVGLCRAMMLDPAVYLFDEPFGALDPMTKAEIQDEVLRIQKREPRTIILITHDFNEAVKMGDSILILENGMLAESGSRDNLIKNARSGLMQHLIQSNRMP